MARSIGHAKEEPPRLQSGVLVSGKMPFLAAINTSANEAGPAKRSLLLLSGTVFREMGNRPIMPDVAAGGVAWAGLPDASFHRRRRPSPLRRMDGRDGTDARGSSSRRAHMSGEERARPNHFVRIFLKREIRRISTFFSWIPRPLKKMLGRPNAGPPMLVGQCDVLERE